MAAAADRNCQPTGRAPLEEAHPTAYRGHAGWVFLLWRYVDDVAIVTTDPRRAARIWAAHATEDLRWHTYLGRLWPSHRTGTRRPASSTPNADESTTAGSGASEDSDSDRDPGGGTDQEQVRAA